MSQQFTIISPNGNGSFSAGSGSQQFDANQLRRNWYKNPSQMNVSTAASLVMDSRNSIVNTGQSNQISTISNSGGGSGGYTVLNGGGGYTFLNGGGSGMNGMNGMNQYGGSNSTNAIANYSKQSMAYGSGSISHQGMITNKATGSIQQDKPVKVYDVKTNKPIDTVPNQLKLPVAEEEYETSEEKEQWTEQQRYLGFSKQKFNAILGVHLAFLILSIAALIVCVVLFVLDSATDYEWKLFGIISSGGLALCLFFGIVFMLLYAKWKYERCKEELEAETENKDNGGNDIKKAGLTKIFKYSKPGAGGSGGSGGGSQFDTNPIDYMATGSDPTPQPTLIHPTMLIQQQRPSQTIQHVRHVQHLQSMPNDLNTIHQNTVYVHEQQPQSRQVITVRRGSAPSIADEPEYVTQIDPRRTSTNSKILYIKPRKKSVVLKNVLKKWKAPSRGINIIPVTSDYVIQEQQPEQQIITKVLTREVRSPSHIPVIEIEPQEIITEAPRVIKISRNEMVASRTPAQSVNSSSSRTQLIQSSLEKKPVILTRNVGEDLNAFRD